MKFNLSLIAVMSFYCGGARAATLAINNLVGGPSDTLYADSSNALMSGGVVAMGYFPAGVTPTNVDQLISNLGSYTLVTSSTPGSHSAFGVAPGYADSTLTTVAGGLVPASGGLFGRAIYSIITNASSLSLATAANQFALVLVGNFKEDSPLENEYFSNPGALGVQVIIGGLSSVTTTTPAGTGDYTTLKMVAGSAVPEPSAILLGVVGFLGLLRRRRN